uniref:aminopeptidase N n=1 Tax=Vespula vulgaris TaxID=7454 RepID=UPI0021290646|nr:aminopeptidase N [Vespula vulgaris]
MWKKTIVAGIFLVSILSKEGKSSNIVPYKWKRSIDLNDIYHYTGHQHRLTEKVIPSSYHLEIEPLMDEGKFKGRVKINVTCMDMLDRITVNAHPDLQISNDVRIRELKSEETENDGPPPLEINVAKTELPTWKKFWYVIHLEQMLKEGDRIELDINYTGNLTTNETSGFFRNEYVDSEGQTHQFVATYLRLNHAQKMFPCLVDPQYKATFKLSVKHPKTMIARSNTPIERSTEVPDEPNMIWNHFVQTPEISVYQLALVVSNFESIVPTQEIDEVNGTKLEIRIWARRDYLDSLKDVPDKIVKIMNYLQNYFNCSIGLTKLDIMAIPMFNAVKASDSWGLMFFKESELSSPLIWNTAYELIYQWIGQYITPYFWNYAPVSKILNSFLASLTTVDINPDEMEGKWPMTILYSLYYEFGKTVPFSRVAGIRYEATAAKAELVFRMFNYTLGKDVFREGVRNFIQQQWDKKTPRVFVSEDIYTRLDEAAAGTADLPQGLTILSVSTAWINQDRLPLVTVIRDYESGDIILSQKVYMREPPPVPNNKALSQWDIPIVMLSENELDFSQTKPSVWLTKQDNEPRNLTIKDIASKDQFIIVNPEEIGMFPVNYDSCNWKMLSQFLRGPNRETIPVLTRAKLLHDSWNLAYAGELCFGIALNMTLFLREETSLVVWEPVFTMIDHVGKRIEGSDVYIKFEAYIRSLLKPLYEKLGGKPRLCEPSWRVHIRGLAKNFLCRAGYEPCVKEAREQYSKWLMETEPDKGNPVANEFICPVYKWGTIDEWEFGLQRVINFPQNSLERKQNERTYLLKTLAGCPKDTYKIQRLLNITILDQNDNFTDSDIQLIFNMLTGGVAGYTTLFNFLTEHWDTIKERFENRKYLWDGIVNSATSSFKTQEGYDMVYELYQTRRDQLESASGIIQEALENIDQEVSWREENLPIIEAWLDENLSKEQLQDIEVATDYTTTTTVTPIAG